MASCALPFPQVELIRACWIDIIKYKHPSHSLFSIFFVCAGWTAFLSGLYRIDHRVTFFLCRWLQSSSLLDIFTLWWALTPDLWVKGRRICKESQQISNSEINSFTSSPVAVLCFGCFIDKFSFVLTARFHMLVAKLDFDTRPYSSDCWNFCLVLISRSRNCWIIDVIARGLNGLSWGALPDSKGFKFYLRYL